MKTTSSFTYDHVRLTQLILASSWRTRNWWSVCVFRCFLCMFTTESNNDEYLPESQREILHKPFSFFHWKSAFYNLRSRSSETKTNPLSDCQTAIVLDFVLPYIGFKMEQKDVFSMTEHEIRNSVGLLLPPWRFTWRQFFSSRIPGCAGDTKKLKLWENLLRSLYWTRSSRPRG